MRIVGGRHRGRPIAAPPGRDVRPTSDRLREALFNILAHGDHPSVEGARVLDAFCGTGAFGLEALSRGAAQATFMDRDITWARRNAEALGEADAVMIRGDVLGPPKADRSVDFGFLDPPYGKALGPPALVALREAGWIGASTAVLLELGKDEPFDAPPGFGLAKERRYGAARLLFLTMKAA